MKNLRTRMSDSFSVRPNGGEARPVTAEDAAIIKGMIARGDNQHDIAAHFGTNGGRICEVHKGYRFPDVEAAAEHLLPLARTAKVTFNRDSKFDIQLEQALIHERRLAEIFNGAKIEKIELKSETWQWEQTGNIAIEYACDGQPSGIAATEADFWVHELRRDDRTLLYLMFPVERLKELAREAYRERRNRRGGDGGRFDVVLLRLEDLLK